jgi:hypothetical protein
MVRVEDDNGYDRGGCTARRLEQIEPKVRTLLDGDLDCSCEPLTLTVTVQLHPDVELSFQVATDLVADATREVEGAVAALLAANMSPQDISVLLGSRDLTARPRRPLVVPNTEIAAVGLDCHPDAIAARWEDQGFAATTYCRRCVDDDPSPWRDLPHATSALIYQTPVHCDGCNNDITTTAAAAQDVREMAADT